MTSVNGETGAGHIYPYAAVWPRAWHPQQYWEYDEQYAEPRVYLISLPFTMLLFVYTSTHTRYILTSTSNTLTFTNTLLFHGKLRLETSHADDTHSSTAIQTHNSLYVEGFCQQNIKRCPSLRLSVCVCFHPPPPVHSVSTRPRT